MNPIQTSRCCIDATNRNLCSYSRGRHCCRSNGELSAGFFFLLLLISFAGSQNLPREDETRRGATAASSSGVNIPPVDQHPFARLPLTLIFSCVWLPQINKQETSKQLSAPSLRPLEVTSEIFSRRDRSPASRFGVCFTRACLALE